MDEAKRAERLQKTRSSAATLLEDFAHLRDVATKPPATGELRRVSALLRRLLHEGLLQDIAAPRIGTFIVSAPDLKPYLVQAKRTPPMLFWAGNATLIYDEGKEIGMSLISMEAAGRSQDSPIYGFDFEARVQLKIESFLKQEVFGATPPGAWLTRKDIILFIANTADGVHGRRAPRTPGETVIAKARHSMSFHAGGPAPTKESGRNAMEIVYDAPLNSPVEFIQRPGLIDPLLVELLAIVQLIVASPDTQRLEKAISAELGEEGYDAS